MDREQLRKALLEHLRQEKGEAPETLADDVTLREGLGLDSIDLVSMVIGIQEQFRIELKTEELEKTQTVGTLLDLIQQKATARRSAA
jgi:acyl carrier protein